MSSQEVYNLGKETYAIYTGQSSSRFSPMMAGITWPDTGYEILRSHSDCYVFEYILSGKGQIQQDQEITAVESGDAYILQAGKYHHYFPDRKDPWKKIWFNVNGSLVRHLLSDYGLDSVLKVPAYGNCRHLSAILEAIEKEPVHCGDELALLLHQYIQALYGFLGDQSVNRSQALAMKNYIEQNLTVPLTIDDIASHVHLSRSRTIHLFREAYAITPYNYYLAQKLDLAQSMLRQTSLSVQEISERLGFSDYHHFSGFFKKNCQISPTRFRKEM